MHAGPSSMMLLMMLMGGGGGNDLLDFVQTRAYWGLQNVDVSVAAMKAQLAAPKADDVPALIKDLTGDDAAGSSAAAARIRAIGLPALPQLEKAAADAQGKPEQAGVIQKLIGQLYADPKGPAVRRLMAIRTLGELKKRDALPVLQPLLKSKALFEAEYARAAIAAIEGKPFTRPGLPAKQRLKDVWMLPANCGVVAQMTMPPGKPVDFAEALKGAGAMFGGQAPPNILPQLTAMLAAAAGRVGNVRLDAVTIGVADNVGKRRSFVVLVARGRYDGKALRELPLQVWRSKTETVDGVEVFKPMGDIALFLPSDDRLVLVGGPTPDGIGLAVAQMIAAVKASKGGLAPARAMGKLVKTVDTTAPVWAAARISEAYREASLLAPFDTITMVGKTARGADNFKLVAVGKDAEKVAAAVKELEGHIVKGRAETAREAQRMPMVKPYADFIGSIKAKADGAQATVTASMKGNSGFLMMPMMMFTGTLKAYP